MKKVISFLVFLIVSNGFGQSLNRDNIQQFADEYFVESVFTLNEFLQLPNIGSNHDNIEQNLKWCINALKALNFDTAILTSEGVNHLLAEKVYDLKSPTILFYLQIDGQPVDPTFWDQNDPFKPVLKVYDKDEWNIISWENLTKNFNPDWRVFARSASDSKGPAIAFLQALRILNEKGISPKFNIKILLDFQEELGSPTLPELVRNNRSKFNADAMLIIDGTRPPNNQPNLTFGARGIATMRLPVFGAGKGLQSGRYGNYAPDPVFSR